MLSKCAGGRGSTNPFILCTNRKVQPEHSPGGGRARFMLGRVGFVPTNLDSTRSSLLEGTMAVLSQGAFNTPYG